MRGSIGAFLPLSRAPLGDDSMTWESVYQLGSGLAADRAPVESIAEDCSFIAESWTELLGDDDELIESCVLTPARLIERVRETGSLENLGAELELEREETVAWLNRLIAAVAETERPTCLDGLIPDQTPEGTFRSSAELSRDTDIDDELKDVLETLGDSIRKRLVHEDIAGAETIIKRVQPRDPVVSSAKDRLKKQVPAKPEAAESRTASLTMFQWLARLEPRGLGLPDLGATSRPSCAYPGPSGTTAGVSWVCGQLKSSARPRAGAAGSSPRRRASEGAGLIAPRSASPLTAGGAAVSGTTGPATGRSLGLADGGLVSRAATGGSAGAGCSTVRLISRSR
jgi:hypothetical protein